MRNPRQDIGYGLAPGELTITDYALNRDSLQPDQGLAEPAAEVFLARRQQAPGDQNLPR